MPDGISYFMSECKLPLQASRLIWWVFTS